MISAKKSSSSAAASSSSSSSSKPPLARGISYVAPIRQALAKATPTLFAEDNEKETTGGEGTNVSRTTASKTGSPPFLSTSKPKVLSSVPLSLSKTFVAKVCVCICFYKFLLKHSS